MEILKHPLFLLAVSAVISGIFIPWFLRRRQYKQQELELKTEIVSDLTESVMKFITTIYLFKTSKEKMEKSPEEELNKALKDWNVRSCVICTKLHSYFPKKKKDEKDLSDEFKDLVKKFYHRNNDNKKEKDEEDLKGKWDKFKDVISGFYDWYTDEKNELNEKEFKKEKEDLFEWKHKIIKKILASKIMWFRSQRIGEILTKGGEKMKWQIKTGLLLIVIGIGIPIVSCFFLESPKYEEFKRELTQNEINKIEEERGKKLEKMRENEAKARRVDRYEKAKFIRQMIEALEEERTLFGEDYYKEVWIIKSKEKSHIPYNYFIGIGFILFFVGIGIIVLSIPSREK